MTDMRANDLSAKLLANENLTVVRANARTASFDIASRVLTLPMWKEMTPAVEDMLIGHEVGHALYTTDKYVEPIRDNPKMMSYMNIIEDVRIEKLIKRKYPGLRKHMNEGYKQLNERDFFGVKAIQDFNELLLIDRINLYFKVGFQCGVTFSADERVFVNRAERCETVEEVIELAKEIYEYSKEQAEQKKQQRQQQGGSADDEDDGEPITNSGDDFDDMEEFEDVDDDLMQTGGSQAGKQHDQEDDLDAKTDRAFQQKLEDLADESTLYRYWSFDKEFYESPVIGFKKILSETKAAHEWGDEAHYRDWLTRNMSDEQRKAHYDKMANEFDTFKAESMRTVNYLVKEFEMKKSAQMYKRASIAKSGSLDMKKIYSYKLQDDIFKRVSTLPQGKNHGMVMLLDWSGSMEHVLQDTLKQVINLVMFCQRIQIPFRVYAFTSQYSERGDHYARHEEAIKRRDWYRALGDRVGTNYLSNASTGFNLLELYSDRMSQSEFTSMSRRLLDNRFRWNAGYSTGGTPLNEALAWCYLNLGDFIKQNQLEKTTFITLTDGEGNPLSSASNSLNLDDHYVSYDEGYKRFRQRNFIKDEVTQKTYEIRRHSTIQTDVILRMIKDRWNVSTVGFYICRNHRGELRSAINHNIPDYNGSVDDLIDSWRKSFRDNNFVSVKNTGRDDLFIIPSTSTKIEDGELDVKADAKATSIAKSFMKYLNVKKTSRVLLNRFVSLVA